MGGSLVAPEILSPTRIRVRLDPLTRMRLEELAKESDMTFGEYVRWVLNRFMPPVQIRGGEIGRAHV